MKSKETEKLTRARHAIMAGNPVEALALVESFFKTMRDKPMSVSDRKLIEPRLTEMRTLAEAALSGAQSAMAQIEEIVQAAKSLQTYDNAGRRHVTSVADGAARRF